MSDRYVVVYEGTGEPGSNSYGIRTIVEYESKEDFEARHAQSNNKDIVHAQGISKAKAQAECDKVPIEYYYNAAFEQSFFNGEFNEEYYQMKKRTVDMLFNYRLTGNVFGA